MAALLKAAKLMALADGKMTNDEMNVMKADLDNFSVEPLVRTLMEKRANEMDGAECIAILSAMSIEQKNMHVVILLP